MSLLGRLEDLSLTDIIQIVFLSRRTGILEIIDTRGRFTVLFRHGLLANASSPEAADLGSYLLARGLITDKALTLLKTTEEAGVPIGNAALEMNFISREGLAAAIQQRIADVVLPLLESRDGEFNFILSDSLEALDIEYEPDSIFRQGGIAPQKILGGEGEKIKPLKGLEESLKAGKALLRGAMQPPHAEAGPGEGGLAGSPPAEAPPAPPEPFAETEPAAVVLPFPQREEAPFDAGYDDLASSEALEDLVPLADEGRAAEGEVEEEKAAQRARFRIAGEGQGERSEKDRNVVLFERDPLVRVAARRAFHRQGFRIFQFGSMDETRRAIAGLLRENLFFVTFLELTSAGEEDASDSVRLLYAIKKKNRHLPVVTIDFAADMRRRHALLKAGSDLYLTRPSEDHLQPAFAEEELALFADELVLFAEKAFSDWEQLAGTFDAKSEIGRQFYDIAKKEKMNRSAVALKQLINELSNPNDIGLVSQTILHLAAEYLERGVLFLADEREFRGLGGFGATGQEREIADRAPRLRTPRDVPSVLNDVVASKAPHRGKMRKQSANVSLLDSLGILNPTEVVVMPIVHHDEVVGVLYGDNAENRSPIDDTSGLEIFLSQAGFAFGNAVTALRQQQIARGEKEQ